MSPATTGGPFPTAAWDVVCPQEPRGGMRDLRQSHGGTCLWNFLDPWAGGSVCLGSSRDSRGAPSPPSGTTGGRRSFGPCNGCTEGTLTIKKRGFGPCRSPGAGSLQRHWDLLLTQQSSFGELTKRSGQGLICACRSRALCASFCQEKTRAIRDQSKAWPELLLSCTTAPRTQTTTTCSKAKPWAGGRAGPGLCCLYLPSPHPIPTPCLVQRHRASPSPQSKLFPEAPRAQHPPAPQDHAQADDRHNS